METPNEKKARELAFKSPQCQMYIDNKCTQNFPCDRFKVSLKMAQWKDEQEIEFLQSLLFQSATQNIFDRINDRIKLLKGE